uniref:Uncharacterized protein n=1 Tax=Rhizophora mucronata TaxID=61149 RepID=A0A2P2PT40_RHIMU
MTMLSRQGTKNKF